MNTLESFEYVDRNYNGKIVQVGMFERITNKDQIKAGDRFICPETCVGKFGNKFGIIDVHSMKPILLFAKSTADFHIKFGYHADEPRGGASVAWDLCYLLRDDI